MKIQIEQKKLMEILDYLYVDGLFPFAIVTAKNGKLLSIQTDKDGFAFRYAEFLSDYFKEITDTDEPLKIDVEKVKGFVRLRPNDAIITLEYPSPEAKNKLKISGGRAHNNLAVTHVDPSEVKTKLPFEIKDGIPYIKNGQTALDNKVSISLSSLNEIKDYATQHGTEFFRFKIGPDQKLVVYVGDVHALEDFTDFEPNCQVFATKGELDVTFTKGIKELAKTFSSDVNISMRSNLPAWFSEVNQSRKFGVLLSPMRGK